MTRAEVLEAVISIIEREGSEHVSVSRVTQNLSMARRFVYVYWPTKNALIADALVEMLLTSRGAVLPDTGDLFADFTEWAVRMRAFLSGVDFDGVRASLLLAIRQDSEFGETLQRRVRAGTIISDRIFAQGGDDAQTANSVIEASEALIFIVLFHGLCDVKTEANLIRLILRPVCGTAS